VSGIGQRILGLTDGLVSRAGGRHARLIMPSRLHWLTPGWLVLVSAVALALLGSYCVSISFGLDEARAAAAGKRHLVFTMLGVVVAGVAALPHYRWVIRFTWPMAALCVLVLVFLLIPFVPEALVQPRKGARRWINLGFTDFQPSELAKIAFVLAIAGYLRHRSNYRRLVGLIPPGIIALVPMGLILVQPDLGTALLFVPTLVAMLVAAGAKLRHLIVTSLLGLVAALTVAGASLALAEHDSYPLLQKHQVRRIQDVLDRYKGDDSYQADRGFQGKAATMVAGAGGFGGNPESKARALVHFSRLPEPHNDMIYAVVMDRFGFVGGVGVIGLYVVWIGSSLWVAGRCKDPFGRLVVVGFATTVGTATVIHIGENLGVFPITGITLPLVSYGGTSMLSTFLMTGLILGIGLRRPEYLWRKSFEFGDDEGR